MAEYDKETLETMFGKGMINQLFNPIIEQEEELAEVLDTKSPDYRVRDVIRQLRDQLTNKMVEYFAHEAKQAYENGGKFHDGDRADAYQAGIMSCAQDASKDLTGVDIDSTYR